jgi:hypothetical protein
MNHMTDAHNAPAISHDYFAPQGAGRSQLLLCVSSRRTVSFVVTIGPPSSYDYVRAIWIYFVNLYGPTQRESNLPAFSLRNNTISFTNAVMLTLLDCCATLCCFALIWFGLFHDMFVTSASS